MNHCFLIQDIPNICEHLQPPSALELENMNYSIKDPVDCYTTWSSEDTTPLTTPKLDFYEHCMWEEGLTQAYAVFNGDYLEEEPEVFSPAVSIFVSSPLSEKIL